jgi:hypothetical protein
MLRNNTKIEDFGIMKDQMREDFAGQAWVNQKRPIKLKDESMTITKIPTTIAQWIERLNVPCLISTFGLCTIASKPGISRWKTASHISRTTSIAFMTT